MSTPAGPRFYPALDGLRTLSVLVVLAFHHGLLAAGWVGVDVFFALSGFLITGILLRSTSSPGYFKKFYAKRATRILPPVILLVFGVTVLTRTISWTSFAYLFFAGNVVELTHASIWLLSPLWSLAIEEHFYLVWPFAIRRWSRELLIRVTLFLLLASPALRFFATLLIRHFIGPQLHWNNPIFLLTPFRLDGLLAGALLALVLEKPAVSKRIGRLALPMSLLAFSLFLGLEALFPGFRRTTDNLVFNTFSYTLTGLASGLLVAHLVLSPKAFVGRLLSLPPLVAVGRITYGMYLFQLPVAAVTAHLFPHLSAKRLFPLDAAGTMLIAALSFFPYERPFVRLGHRLATDRALLSGTGLAASSARATPPLSTINPR